MSKAAKKEKIHMLLYGDAGSGKSILASTFPKCLYFDFDRGTTRYEKHFSGNKYLRGEGLISTLQKALQKAKEGTLEYETIVLDSLTNLEKMAINKFKGLGVDDWNRSLYRDSNKKLEYDGWGNISGSTTAILSHMRDLPVNVVIITQIAKDKEGLVAKKQPDLIGKSVMESLHFADVVGYLYKEDNTRYLAINARESDRFYAKARTLAGEQPPIEKPNYEKLAKVLGQDEIKLEF